MKLAIVIVALAIAGCGGGGPPCQPVRIQLFGDSTTVGYQADVTPQIALQDQLDRHYGTGRVIVSTTAFNGTSSTDLVAGTNGYKSWPTDLNAEIAVIGYGIVDHLYRHPAAKYVDNLRRLAVGPARIVFQTPLPYWSPINGPIAHSYAPEMRAAAAQLNIPIIDNNATAESIADWQPTYAPDGIHPTSAGYQLLAARAKPAIIAIIDSLGCTR